MRFLLPAWLAIVAVAGIAAASLLAYRHPRVPLTLRQRAILTTLRALSLGAIALMILRPVVFVPPSQAGTIVPILIDVSRSMAIADADGTTRLASAISLFRDRILPALPKGVSVDLYGVGAGLTPASVENLAANATRSDLSGAIASLVDRYRARRVGGIVLLSDGGDTGQGDAQLSAKGPPVLAIGLGTLQGPPDREVTGITAGDPRLDQASVDLHVSAVSRGFDRTPFQVRVLANGLPVETRQVAPQDSVPIDEVFTVFPDPTLATVYTADIVAQASDSIPQNDASSVVVNPAGRKRRVLLLAGAPGFDYSFLARALGEDPALEIDSVVRKGKNDQNVDTFLVQAGAARGQALMSGFPASREALAAYDAVLIGNIEGEFFSQAQLQMIADFVSMRGGGLLVLGGRSFEQRGLKGTALEAVLPVEPADRLGSASASVGEGDRSHDTITLTADGQNHPIMRIGTGPEESRKLWASLPALAFNAPVGGPRPGASVLAVTTASSGAILPVVVVQRYGRGRSMVFSGEASWRWRMLLPAGDRRYEFFWRQAVRWLTADAPDPVSMTLPAETELSDAVRIDVDVRNEAFAPVADATLSGTSTAPGGETTTLSFRPGSDGRFVASGRAETTGLHRIRIEARRGETLLGSADRWLYVGAAAREFADPRLNEAFLRRLARQSGGAYARPGDVASVLDRLREPPASTAGSERRDLWQRPWVFAFVTALLSAEWILRRMWGLR